MSISPLFRWPNSVNHFTPSCASWSRSARWSPPPPSPPSSICRFYPVCDCAGDHRPAAGVDRSGGGGDHGPARPAAAKKLAELAKQSAHESTLQRGAGGKRAGAGGHQADAGREPLLQQWNSYIQITAESGLRTRELTQNLISWG